MDYTALIGLGLSFLQGFLSNTRHKLPAEVISAVQAAIDAVSAHYSDLINKANLEAQRG